MNRCNAITGDVSYDYYGEEGSPTGMAAAPQGAARPPQANAGRGCRARRRGGPHLDFVGESPVGSRSPRATTPQSSFSRFILKNQSEFILHA